LETVEEDLLFQERESVGRFGWKKKRWPLGEREKRKGKEGVGEEGGHARCLLLEKEVCFFGGKGGVRLTKKGWFCATAPLAKGRDR